MKKEKIKPLFIVKAYARYFIRRARKVLNMKIAEYDSLHVDLHDLDSVGVWFFCKTDVIAHVQFNVDGRVKDKDDIIDKRKEA
ncbi:MAG: hypothetical protein E3J87_02255, partial [Candidatus Cloacimonadota bacterium]